MPKRESCASILLAPRPPSRSPPTYDPHSARCTAGCHTSRDFVHWRFSDAGRRSAWIASSCRRPKTCTGAAVAGSLMAQPVYPQSTKSLRSSPLRGSKSRGAGSRSRGQRWRGGKVNTISSCIVGVQRMIKNSKDHLAGRHPDAASHIDPAVTQ